MTLTDLVTSVVQLPLRSARSWLTTSTPVLRAPESGPRLPRYLDPNSLNGFVVIVTQAAESHQLTLDHLMDAFASPLTLLAGHSYNAVLILRRAGCPRDPRSAVGAPAAQERDHQGPQPRQSSRSRIQRPHCRAASDTTQPTSQRCITRVQRWEERRPPGP